MYLVVPAAFYNSVTSTNWLSFMNVFFDRMQAWSKTYKEFIFILEEGITMQSNGLVFRKDSAK